MPLPEDLSYYYPSKAGPCHHGMARLQVADGGTASKMEGRCEYLEYVVVDSLQGVVLKLGSWARC
jgi:hypothetical protein